MGPQTSRPPRDTGPIELRDFGPEGRRLGTEADCYDGSPWELHRGELVEQMGSKDIHGITMALIAALFRTHARVGHTVMTDVYCDLTDEQDPSLRAPDVALVSDLSKPRNEAYRGTPVLAVEVRGTRSKRYLEEKVKLYAEHDWPCVWIAHAERRELEVIEPNSAPIVYRQGAEVPLIGALQKHALERIPAAALFDERVAERYLDGWVEARGEAQGRARSILDVLAARGFVVDDATRARILACGDLPILERWLVLAARCGSVDELSRALER